MAEERENERTEPATPRKREEARQKGTVARSNDLNVALICLASVLLVFFLGGHVLQEVRSLTANTLGDLGASRLTVENVLAYTIAGAQWFLFLLLPFALGLVVLALLVNFLQVGFVVSSESIAPDFTRLDPMRGLRRIFSRRGLMRLVFGLFKLVVIGGVLYWSFASILSLDSPESVFGVLNADLGRSVEYSRQELLAIGGRAAAAMLILAILDFAFQRWQHERDLMMTKQEVREELRRMEGDPKLKERRRKIGRQLALQRMMKDVPRADVVITNPTHYAVALEYKDRTMRAPKLLAKGQGFTAQRIREIAMANEIPIVEEPPLARSIYHSTEVGHEIPPDLYQPVAEVLAYVYRIGRATRAGAA